MRYTVRFSDFIPGISRLSNDYSIIIMRYTVRFSDFIPGISRLYLMIIP